MPEKHEYAKAKNAKIYPKFEGFNMTVKFLLYGNLLRMTTALLTCYS